jgi:thiol-disulfide isomerase/thioredoxin
VRAPVDHIAAPPFPDGLEWVNVAVLRMDQQRGRPVLVEFWDFCRANSMRTLPYVKGWADRYGAAGLRVVGVHTPGFAPSQDPAAVRAAVARLGIGYPVAIDSAAEVWNTYENLGWPARYLFTPEGYLFDYHYGEGGYRDTELAIQELLEVSREPMDPLRPEDAPGARLVPQSEDIPGPYSGPYEAGGVWAVLEGDGWVAANRRRLRVDHPGAYELIAHPHSTTGVLALELGGAVTCHAVCFTPGLAPLVTARRGR